MLMWGLSRLVELSGQNIRLEDFETNFSFAWVLEFAIAQILDRCTSRV